MIRSILVPLDGSDFAEHALPLAAGLARKSGAKLHLAHVHQPVSPAAFAGGVVAMDVDDLHARQDEQAYLADVARRLNDGKERMSLKTALLFGDVGEAIESYCVRESVELVVMATHARGAFARFWLGSVSDELASRLSQPVLLVRPGEGKPDLDRDAGLDSIVVPLDGSHPAEKAIWPAAELAQLFDAELSLVRVVRPAIRPDYLPEGGGSLSGLPEAQEAQRRDREQARKYLEQIASGLAVRGIRVRADVMTEERPAAGILAEADARHAGLIALETHARRGLARLLFGSVAGEVVRGGEVPVLLHHAPD